MTTEVLDCSPVSIIGPALSSTTIGPGGVVLEPGHRLAREAARQQADDNGVVSRVVHVDPPGLGVVGVPDPGVRQRRHRLGVQGDGHLVQRHGAALGLDLHQVHS
jgi:hypothetical protein